MKSNKSGLIFSIKRFEINDGVGVRTTVFLKGCPLECLWCHNPEGLSKKQEIGVFSQKCIGCMDCANECECHLFTDSGRVFLRDKCKGCMKCADLCVSGAIVEYGKKYSAEEVLFEVLKDREIYEKTGGGITLSGGEPFAQNEATVELLKACKANGLSTVVETCGYCNTDVLISAIPYVDLFLWDIKDTDDKRHKQYTGVSNKKILENLSVINELGAKIRLRCILVNGVNTDKTHYKELAAIAKKINNFDGLELIPYHAYGGTKSVFLGFADSGSVEWIPTEQQILEAKTILKSEGVNVI